MPLQTRLRNYLQVLLYDAALVALSYVVSLLLRLGDHFSFNNHSLVPGALIVTLTYVMFALVFRVYQQVWRYISIQDLLTIAKTCTLSLLCMLPLLFWVNRLEDMPRSLPLINWLVMVALLAGMRLLVRLRRNEDTMQNLTSIPEKQKISVLLVGVNTLSESFLRDTVGNRYAQYRVVGMLDNDLQKIGRNIRGVPVYHRVREVQEVLEKLQAQDIPLQKIIITPDTISGKDVSFLLQIAENHGLTVALLPRLTDFRQTKTSKLELKKIDVEDLLGRPQKTLNLQSMDTLIRGKRVFITGAGGTIGSELARQIASYAPAALTLYEQSEHHLYLIDMELRTQHAALTIHPVVGDVRNSTHVRHHLQHATPDIVFHAAALKHVPMSELNVCEAIATNIFGTQNVADACRELGIGQMVQISTDKAVSPTNVMGATKRFAEHYIQTLNQKPDCKTLFTVLRFGNVLGSTGSVVPLFQKQLQQGGPLTVTHPDITRYFMTVREAVELVLQAAALAHENDQPQGHMFVLDMGQPVKIVELAEQMIRLAGLRPHEDIQISYTGMRPGEKLHEELFYPHEHLLPTVYEGILLARTEIPAQTTIAKALDVLHENVATLDDALAHTALQTAVPDFIPLDQA